LSPFHISTIMKWTVHILLLEGVESHRFFMVFLFEGRNCASYVEYVPSLNVHICRCKKGGRKMDFLNSSLIHRLERSLDATSLRQNVITHNIANVDTPGFKRSTVKFEEFLQAELNQHSTGLEGRRTHEKHIRFGSTYAQNSDPVIATDHTTIMNNNKNNVDVDAEMSLLAKNQLTYNMLVQQMSHEMRSIRTSIGR